MTGKRRLRGSEPLVAAPQAREHCPLCGRVLPQDATVDEHHLVPRSHGGKLKERIHRICHRKIHATLTEGELARSYNTWSQLHQHPDLAAFIAWVANKPPSFWAPSRAAKGRGVRQA